MPKSCSNFSRSGIAEQYQWGWVCPETNQERKFSKKQTFIKCFDLHKKRCSYCNTEKIMDSVDLTKQQLKIMNKRAYISKKEITSQETPNI